MDLAEILAQVGSSAKRVTRVAESKGTPTAGRSKCPMKRAYIPAREDEQELSQ